MIQSAGAGKWVTVGGKDGSSSGIDRCGIATTEPALDTGELLKRLSVVHHQGNLRVQLVHAVLQGLNLADLLNDFLAETLDSQLFLVIGFGIVEEMYEVLDCSDADVCSEGELAILFSCFLRTDEGLDVDDLFEILPVVPSLRLEFPALNSTSKQSLKEDGDIFACPQVISPRVVIQTNKCTSADGLEPNYVRLNKFEFLSGLPVLGSGQGGPGTSLEAVDGRDHLDFRKCLRHHLVLLFCKICSSTGLDADDSGGRFAKVPDEDKQTFASEIRPGSSLDPNNDA